jgi:hypothetical protein
MKVARLIGEGAMTVGLRFCDVSLPHLRIVLTPQGKLTTNRSLQWGMFYLFRNVTGGPGNSVH